MDVREFSVFCPKVLAGIDTGRLPETVEDRSIVLRMKRRQEREPVERLRSRSVRPEAEVLRGALETWAAAVLAHLREAMPELPDELGDRAADAWESLLAIADLAGEEWPARGRAAAIELSTARGGDEVGRGTQLLAAIRAVMSGADTATTAKLLHRINADESLPFGGWGDGRGIDARALAKVLKPYGVRPRTIRHGAETAKGYSAADLRDAWERYLPTGASQPTQASQAAQRPTGKPQPDRNVTDVTPVTAGADIRDVCAYETHSDDWRPHPRTAAVICWRCHPPARAAA